MSLDAFIIRSRRSWCSSSSVRKVANMGMKGGTEGGGSAVSSSLRGCLMPAIAGLNLGKFELSKVRAEFGIFYM